MKKLTRKHYLVSIQITDGENKYSQLMLMTTTKRDISTKSYDYIKTFYGSQSKPDGEGFSFNNGDLFVKVGWYRLLPKKHYLILKEYL